MSSVPPRNAEIVVVRETLEGVLSHEVAVRVMFEALHVAEVVPESLDEVIGFVNGPLRDVLSAQIGPVVVVADAVRGAVAMARRLMGGIRAA